MRRPFRSLQAHPWQALPFAIGVALAFGVGSSLGGTLTGATAASGALMGGAAGSTAGARASLPTMIAAGLGLGLSAFLGSITAGNDTVRLCVVGIEALVCGLIVVVSPYASTVALQALIGFIVYGRFPADPAAAAGRALGVLAGAACQIPFGAISARRWPGRGAGGAVRAHLRLVRDAVRRPGPDAWWHALRLALAAVSGEALAVVMVERRGYWIALTAVVVLKPEWATTATRSLERWLGTALGVIPATVLISVGEPTGWRLALLLGATMWAGYSIFPDHYALYSAFISFVVVVLVSVLDASARHTALDRVVDTTIGGVLALVIALVARPISGRRPDRSTRRGSPG